MRDGARRARRVRAGAGRSLPTAVGEGRYRVQRLLGEGSRKVVYAASDTRLGRDVAVAIIKTDGLDDAGRRRIDREARAMARLGDHPNIVTVFDVGDENGEPYIVSELMPGGSVSDAIERAEDHRLPIADALRIGEQIALALEHAHERGVVHRDLKPANVWMAADGTARLGDFGLAVEADRSRITSEGMVVGTVAYLAPEQAVGRAPDKRSDLYALGTSLYEMLTGRPPFLGDDAVTVISQHLNTAPVSPTWHNAEVTPPIEALVLALLEKDPAARPADAGAVVAELRRLQAVRPAASAAAPTEKPAPVTQAASFGRFVGRAEELEGLKALFDETLSGKGRLVMVVGEPGIGKTRLTEELGVYTAVRGAQVCWGHCYEGELGVPYLPFVEALRTYVRDKGDDELRAELSTGAPEVATIVSDLRVRFPDLPVSPALDGDAERMRLFEGVSAFLANAAAARPLVLMLDDLHWADKPTLLLLQYLARNLRRERVMIVCTYRDVELDRTHPLADMIASLRREHLYERVLLARARPRRGEVVHRGGRRAGDTGDLRGDGAPGDRGQPVLRRRDPAPPRRERRARTRRRSLGGQRGRRRRAAARRGTRGDRAPALAPRRRLQQDADDRRRDAGRVHARGREPCPRHRRRCRARSPRRGARAADPAGAPRPVGHLRVQPRADPPDALLGAEHAPPHPHAPPDPRRARRALRRAHRRAPHGARVSRLPGRAGRRRRQGGRLRDPRRRSRGGVGRATKKRHGRTTSRSRPSSSTKPPTSTGAPSCSSRSATRTTTRATPMPARDALALAAEIGRRARRAGAHCPRRIDHEQHAAAGAGSRRRHDGAAGGRGRAARSARRRAARSRPGGTRQSDRVHRRRPAREPGAGVGGGRAALGRSGCARDCARQPRDSRRLGWQSGERRARYLEVARLAAEAGDLATESASCISLAITALYLGQRAELDDSVATHGRLAERSRSPYLKYSHTYAESAIAILEGRYADGERLAGEALEIARRTRDAVSVSTVGVVLYPLLREQGRSADLEDPTRRMVEAQPRVTSWRSGLAQVLADQGKLDEAAEQIEAVARDGFAIVADDVLRTYTLCGTAEVTAILRDTALAEQLYVMLEPDVGCASIHRRERVSRSRRPLSRSARDDARPS